MHWEILIIPLIALGVWILGTLFKGEDEKLKKGVRRPGRIAARPPSRRPVTDLDRFLEEARRRREKEERPKPPPAPPPVRAPVERTPLRERPSQRREAPPRTAPPPARREEAPVVPVAQPVAVEPVLVTPPSRAVSPPTPPSTAQDTPSSSIPRQIRSLLSKPQTAATAFALREIFDRPLCKRRRRHEV